MNNPVLWIFWLAAAFVLGGLYYLVRRAALARRSSDRLFVQPDSGQEPPAGDPAVVGGALRRWLFLAGYRGPMAPAVYIGTILLAAGVGLAGVHLIGQLGFTGDLARNISEFPSGVSDLFMPLVYLGPWSIFLILVCLPWIVVRRARRTRVEQVEHDLPVSLELLATLSESGLGFDAALAHVLESIDTDRALAREFITYQSNVLAGRTRVEAMRRLARRLEVPSVSIFVSALVQAEQMGSGISQTLCRQAEDLRNRRRERATGFAMALPIKRMFPLVICFLPGIFVWTLGPFFHHLLQFADTFMQIRSF